MFEVAICDLKRFKQTFTNLTSKLSHQTPPIYVYDGECVICSRTVRYVFKHDKSDPPIHFVAIKSSKGREIASKHGIDPDAPKTFIYIENDKAFFSSDAAFALFNRAGGPARHLQVFRFIPRKIRDWFYSFVASNRYSLFGKLDKCYLPPEELRNRFVLDDE